MEGTSRGINKHRIVEAMDLNVADITPREDIQIRDSVVLVAVAEVVISTISNGQLQARIHLDPQARISTVTPHKHRLLPRIPPHMRVVKAHLRKKIRSDHQRSYRWKMQETRNHKWMTGLGRPLPNSALPSSLKFLLKHRQGLLLIFPQDLKHRFSRRRPGLHPIQGTNIMNVEMIEADIEEIEGLLTMTGGHLTIDNRFRTSAGRLAHAHLLQRKSRRKSNHGPRYLPSSPNPNPSITGSQATNRLLVRVHMEKCSRPFISTQRTRLP